MWPRPPIRRPPAAKCASSCADRRFFDLATKPRFQERGFFVALSGMALTMMRLRRHAMRILRPAFLVLLAVFLPLRSSADISAGYVQPFAKHDMVAAANPLAAEAGLEMLRAGGSAVDAAIAV